MSYIIGVTEIPGELWAARSHHDSEESALACTGTDGEYIVRESDGAALWRWDGSGRWVRAEWS